MSSRDYKVFIEKSEHVHFACTDITVINNDILGRHLQSHIGCAQLMLFDYHTRQNLITPPLQRS